MKKQNSIHIKNMVCPRCIAAVDGVFEKLDIEVNQIELGQVFLSEQLAPEKEEKLNQALKKLGFELLSSQKSKTISKIKTLIIDQIHHKQEPLTINFSDYLSQEMHQSYQVLSRLFSEVEGITINRFIVIQKIEKVKELLFYDELSTAEIADLMNYNSVAYLSSIFKKETGMTITEFKKLKASNRSGIVK